MDETLCKAILRKLDFSRAQFDKDMADYSAGQKKKVLLARSLCQSAHLYVWDEPLNYIDVFSRMQLERLLQAYHPAMLLVEHDRPSWTAWPTSWCRCTPGPRPAGGKDFFPAGRGPQSTGAPEWLPAGNRSIVTGR